MKLLTPWGEKLNENSPLSEYPRMQLQRDSFFPLNGVWEYLITAGREPKSEDTWKKIVVPFALGSVLSGTEDTLQPQEVLWYRREFSYPLTDSRVMLNFEAVDQCCDVFINGQPVGRHEGGYAPFSLDISETLKTDNEILVRVTDASDQGQYAYGKQKLENGGMWYTPSSGIWQSVWIEEIPEHSVYNMKITPDYDRRTVYLQLEGDYYQAVITVFEGKKLVHRGITIEKTYTFTLDEMHVWSPDDPFLYDLYIETENETIKSYFGMRKFSIGADEDGHMRFLLNEKPVFLSGLLDQGYTSDGLMTYPSSEAMEYEIRKIRDMGFNMLRKHVKQECRRWYYLCDKYGILVMQDMPNGGGPYSFSFTAVKPNFGFNEADDHDYKLFGRANPEGRKQYVQELDSMIDTLYNCVSIFAWVPFNEGWGQFDSRQITERIRQSDPTRLIDSASGWYDQGCGDFRSIHNYFFPFRVPKKDGRVILLSEFGGYSFLEWGHTAAKKLYGYKKFKDKVVLGEAVEKLYLEQILKNIPKGLSGCIYTQVSDVEDECNGLFTADRRILKIEERRMRRVNDSLIRRNRNGKE